MWTTLLLALAAQASDTIVGGAVTLTIEANGERIEGVVAYDAAALAAQGIRVGAGEGTVLATYGLPLPGADGGVLREHTDAFVALDRDGDGALDADDATFSAVRLFVDQDGDGVAQAGDLRSLEDLGIQRISRWGEVAFRERILASR